MKEINDYKRLCMDLLLCEVNWELVLENWFGGIGKGVMIRE